MKRLPDLFRWLIIAALADWLITRTLTRAGAFIPKSNAWIATYQIVSAVALAASTLAGIIALATLVWTARQEWKIHRKAAFPFIILLLVGLNVVFLFTPAVGWLGLANRLLLLVVLGYFFGRVRSRRWLLLPVLALITGNLYQLLPALFESLHLAGPAPFSLTLFNLGEILVVMSGLSFGWVAWRNSILRDRFLAAIPAVLFAGMFLSVPAMAGIFSIWSVGLTLFLPWPFYVLSLWAVCIATMKAIREDNIIGWGILLLAAGGYASQLSTQSFYGIIGVWVLVYAVNWGKPDVKEPGDLLVPARIQTKAFHH